MKSNSLFGGTSFVSQLFNSRYFGHVARMVGGGSLERALMPTMMDMHGVGAGGHEGRWRLDGAGGRE